MTELDAERLFHEARSLPASERADYVDRACAGDAALRRRVEALLKADAEAGSFLDAGADAGGDPPDGDNASGSRATRTGHGAGAGSVVGSGPGLQLASGDTTQPDPAERVGERIGHYKLLQRIGEGGFGSVWMAEQREPVKRKVALKIIKLGMDTRQVIARFEAERQALAMMDHPNIAKVLDAGTTDTGRPYFVMEYIRGVPIIDYCDTEMLDTPARLALFIDVCHAIQHAHQKGVIHRDLKPSNVMVTLHDGRPVPIVIDFGIAKATHTELTTMTLFTQHRQMIGTPAYMSPEQAEMSGLDIDTRSDVYSLGVLLYELLTGTTPFDTRELMEKGYAEMVRIIREVEPHRPSTRLSTLGETATRTAQRRHTDVKRLGTLIRGDLDWIVMKCLEKDRRRRYETANGLAADIERHLKSEPVLAGPPSAAYRVRKFVRRNRGQVVAAGIVLAALLAGIAGTTAGLVWALDQKSRAETAEEATERELARANEVKRLIVEMLESVDPEVAQTADTTLLKGILDDAAARLTRGEIENELVAAELHEVVGRAYHALGLYDAAERHASSAAAIRARVQGALDSDTLRCKISLALVYKEQGRFDEADALCGEALEQAKRGLGESHPTTLKAMNLRAGLHRIQGRYAESESEFLEVIELRTQHLGADHADTLASVHNLALLYKEQGRRAEAEPHLLRVYEAFERAGEGADPHTLSAMSTLAALYMDQGRSAEAEQLLLTGRETALDVYGAEHPRTVGIMSNLATLYSDQNRYAEAEAMFLEVLEISTRVLGDDHPRTLAAMNNLASVYMELNRFEDAELLNLRTLESYRRIYGAEHRRTLGSITNLGHLYNTMGRYDDAVEMYEESLPVKRRILGVAHPWTGYAIDGLAYAYTKLGRYEKARPLIRELLDIRLAAAQKPDAGAMALFEAARSLIDVDPAFGELRDVERALALAQAACTLEKETGGSQLWLYLDTLAVAQHETGDSAAAVESQRRSLAMQPADHPERADYERRLAEYEAAVAAQGESNP